MAVLLDVDNTLTPPRQPLTREMAETLKRLRVPFHVAAGSDMTLLEGQLFEPLYRFGFRKQFHAFISNGATHYRCDYSKGMSLEVVSEFNLRDYLGHANYKLLLDVLTQSLNLEEFRITPPLEVIGERIIHRGSMINFCPIGRVVQESHETQRNRGNFVEFDRAHKYRARLIDHLEGELSSLISDRGLTISLGGQTSFDIGIAGQDKSNAVRTLLRDGVERLVFIGDALFEGGNDAPIRRFAEGWRSAEPCPLEIIQVSSWNDTIRKFYELGVVDQRD